MSDRDDDGVGEASESRYDPRFDPRFQRGYAPESDPAAEDDTARPTRGTGAGIDPRFDPRFQRGYDADRHEQVRRPAAPADDGPAAYSSTVKPALVGRVVPAPALDAAIPASTADADPRLDLDPVSDAVAGEDSGGPPRPALGRNPYLIALWIACSLLVLGGGWIIVQAAGNPTARFVASVAVGDVFARTAWTIGPLCVTVGLIGLIALALVHAVAWLRRHPDADG